jgi:thioredoxin reductase
MVGHQMTDTVIVGAGPYGLAIGAHLKRRGIPFRIFGRPMDSWRAHMPKGMLLKSDGFASNISDPDGQLTLERFCQERSIPYGHTGIPVRLETFTEYGLTFRDRLLPELEDKMVVSVEPAPQGFSVRTEDGEIVHARVAVLAVGITHFEYVPDTLAHLPPEFLSHSARHSEVEVFSGRNVLIIGAGASALDWAGLLYEAGVNVQIVSRQTSLKFHGRPNGKPRSLWQRIQKPQTGIGPGWKASFYANAPGLFHHLPENLRLEIVERTLGPSGGWFIKDKVVGKVPPLLGYSIKRAQVEGGQVRLELRAQDGTERLLTADHVIAATGYRVDLERLTFLSPQIRSCVKCVKRTPILSSEFESSVPGLYFAGLAAANSFGPVMRFAYGADFCARTLARALSRSYVREPERYRETTLVSAAK